METFLVGLLAVITAASNIWQAYEARQANYHYAESNRIALGGEAMADQSYKPSRRPQLVMITLTILTWTAVGFDYHDRHRGIANWDESTPMVRVYGSQRRFVNETVQLDGRHFIDPVFDGVTFMYEGTAPFRVDNPQFILHPGQVGGRLGSHNPVVNQTIEIMHTLEGAAGCTNTGTATFPPESK